MRCARCGFDHAAMGSPHCLADPRAQPPTPTRAEPTIAEAASWLEAQDAPEAAVAAREWREAVAACVEADTPTRAELLALVGKMRAQREVIDRKLDELLAALLGGCDE